MLSSRANASNGGDTTMPGSYETLSRLTRPDPPSSPEPEPITPASRTPFPRLPTGSPSGESPPRTSFLLPPRTSDPAVSPMRGQPMIPRRRRRRRRRKRRPLTPDIVIERRSRSHCRSSHGRRRIITIPLNDRPTLGLRGPPERIIEIERIPCRRIRRRKHRSVCYEDPPPPPTIIANPIPNPCLIATQPSLVLPTTNTAVDPLSYLSNLSAEMIQNLPKQTVHLPPIHLPGSRANANTELDTILLPTEIINPLDGTLSVIQANPGGNLGATMNIQQSIIPNQSLITIPNQSVVVGVQNQASLISIPRPAITPRPIAPIPRGTASDPLMQRFQELFQRLRLPQTRAAERIPSPPIIRPTAFNTSQTIPMNNSINGPPTIPLTSTAATGSYPSANIRPIIPSNNGPSAPTLTTPYRSSTFTPSMPTSNPSYRPATTIEPSNSSDIGPYRPANITPYRSSTFTPSTPANITPYRSSTFTPSTPANNQTYRPTSVTFSNASDTSSPYRPANITPYSNTNNQSNNNPVSTSYASAPSIASSRSFTPFPPLSSNTTVNNNGIYSNAQSSAPTTYQSTPTMPKSILRNAQSTNTSNTVYTPLAPSNLFS